MDYRLELHKDGTGKHEIKTEIQVVQAGTKLVVPLLENGGFCGVLSPADRSREED
ncbi:MAG: hypothetical protein NTU53_17030 [Planctomycetota bacterium]|nr:hypothetical protein [Planctomycetota bacterium]